MSFGIDTGKNNVERGTNDFAKKISFFYSFETVVRMQPASLNTNDFKSNEAYYHVSSEKSPFCNLSYSAISEDEELKEKNKNKSYKHNFSKILKNKNFGKFHLLIGNTLKNDFTTINLEGYSAESSISFNHTFGRKSGYYFIYDNQGTVHVILEKVKVCELNLPDRRIDPTLFAYEDNIQLTTILFLAGGYVKHSNSKLPFDNVAVFCLNLKDISKMITYEPWFYVKMKYQRMSPILFVYRNNKEKKLMILGGGFPYRQKGEKKSVDINSHHDFYKEINLMCETISMKRIKKQTFQSDFKNMVINTEDCLILMINGKPNITSISTEKLNKVESNLLFNIGECAAIKVNDTKNKNKKIVALLGIGSKKNEVWFIDMIDFVEHKIYIYQSKQKLNPNKYMCSSMAVNVGDEVYYLDGNESEKDNDYQKISIKNIVINSSRYSGVNCSLY